MESLLEKKWFLYLGDHHEGPFSLSEIQKKFKDREITKEHYIWTEGMPQWKMIYEIPECVPWFSTPIQAPPFPQSSGSIDLSELPELEPTYEAISARPSDEPTLDSLKRDRLNPNPISPAAEMSSPVELQSFSQRGNKPLSMNSYVMGERSSPYKTFGLVILLGLLIGAVVYTRAYQIVLEQPWVKEKVEQARKAVPVLSQWLSPIPKLDDVEISELESLRMAAESQTSPVALALSTKDLERPTFYVASSLPDGATFDIHILGVEDTLLNHLDVQGRRQIKLTNHLAKTQQIVFKGGSAVPQGYYEVTLTESNEQPPAVRAKLNLLPTQPESPTQVAKVFIKKKYFLGGKNDRVYAERLKAYHDKLVEKSTGELTELKQIAETVQTQWNALLNKLPHLKKKTWDAYYKKWTPMLSQIATQTPAWSSDGSLQDLFHRNLYVSARDTLNQMLTISFETAQDQVKKIDEQLLTLRAKIDKAKEAGTTPNGMPVRVE